MKKYLKPELECYLFDDENVIVCSKDDDQEYDGEWFRPEDEDE